MTDNPEDVIVESEGSMRCIINGDRRRIRFPLTQYSDQELLDLAEELLSHHVEWGDPHNNAWAMGYVGLELNRRLYREVLGNGERV